MVKEMRRVIRASWIVNIKNEGEEQCKDLWATSLLHGVKGPVRGLLLLQTRGDEAHIYFISYLVRAWGSIM